ncbi:type VII secretion integral membrane protein EccD [Streptomyces sp. NPDC088194]|uniref:type VII secretion integral membrane protein EccD n=1 Tax=Streptomyces sp. NPDC088194 TaxID=3154931 RepID=UPI00344E8E8A
MTADGADGAGISVRKAAGPGPRGGRLSRVSLVGARRRMDLVLPSDEPVGRLLPDIIEMLDDRVATQPMLRQLVTSDGSVVPHDGTLRDAGVLDGTVLRLVRVQDVPSAPVVHDVTDEVAEDLDVRAWRWSPQARRITAGAALVGWLLVGGLLARVSYAPSAVAATLLALGAVLAVAGAVAGRAGRRGAATALITAAGPLAALGAWTLGDAEGWSAAGSFAGVAVMVFAALLLLGAFTPLGRAGVLGAVMVGVVAAVAEAAAAAQHGAGTAPRQAHTGAVLAVVCVVLLGVLPRLALSSAGLTALDDERADGASVSRHRVASALDAAHRGLVLATAVVGGGAAVAAVLALRTPTVWTVPLAVITALVLALRSRAYPLVTEVVLLLLAAAAVAVRGAVLWSDRSGAAGALAGCAVLGAFPLVLLAVEPPEHVRVRFRRLADTAEAAGVIALFPLLVGVFGVYGHLLDTFA